MRSVLHTFTGEKLPHLLLHFCWATKRGFEEAETKSVFICDLVCLFVCLYLWLFARCMCLSLLLEALFVHEIASGVCMLVHQV